MKKGCAYCKQCTEWGICDAYGVAKKPHKILFCPMCGQVITVKNKVEIEEFFLDPQKNYCFECKHFIRTTIGKIIDEEGFADFVTSGCICNNTKSEYKDKSVEPDFGCKSFEY